jgi:hypothetical protein
MPLDAIWGSLRRPDGGLPMSSCHLCINGIQRGDGFPVECPCQDEVKHIANDGPTISNDLKWQPGTYGKGWVLEDGSVWTWPVDEISRKPYHMDKSFKMKQQDLAPMRDRGDFGFQTGSFEIDPDGVVHRLNGPVAPEFMQAILNADPRLKNLDNDPWRLSDVIPEDRWAWIGS